MYIMIRVLLTLQFMILETYAGTVYYTCCVRYIKHSNNVIDPCRCKVMQWQLNPPNRGFVYVHLVPDRSHTSPILPCFEWRIVRSLHAAYVACLSVINPKRPWLARWQSIINSYWIRLSMIARIIKAKVCHMPRYAEAEGWCKPRPEWSH